MQRGKHFARRIFQLRRQKMLKIAVCSFLILVGSIGFAVNIQDSYLAEARGDYQSALSVMQSLSREDPTELFYTMRTAWLEYLAGDYGAALLNYQKAQRVWDHQDAQIGVINCRLALAEWDAVITYCDQLLAEDTQNTLLLAKAAYAAYMKKSYLVAAEYFARIKRINPWDMENRGYLVNNLYLGGKLVEARQEYKNLKKYHPQSKIVDDYREVLDIP